MFGGDLVPPVNPKHRRPRPMVHDIQMPDVKPGIFAHQARPVNTDYHVRLLHYKQKATAAVLMKMANDAKRLENERFTVKYDVHFDKKRFQREVSDKIKTKLEAHEQAVERRREKLRQMLDLEEREFYWEVVDRAQRGGETKMEEHKKRIAELQAKREAERQEVVNKKRLQQYMLRCHDLRPAIMQKNLMETKNAQLQQMRENEAKREAERELDKLWYDVMMKDIKTKMHRESQESLAKRFEFKDMLEILDAQVKGKQLLQGELKRLQEEDAVEMEKLAEQTRREEMEALESNKKKNEKYIRELKEQIELQKKISSKRKEEEMALEDAFNYLAQLQIDKEKAAVVDSRQDTKREMALYRAHLEEMERERQEEERIFEQVLEENKKAIEKKYEEAKCKLHKAREDLKRDVMAGRAEQLRLKQKEAEEQLKMQQAENELMRMACETNACLEAEHARLRAEAAKQYREDLKKQIEYSEELRKREREELERQLKAGLLEEERYKKLVQDMLEGKVQMTEKHPFRQVLERYDCHCPTERD